MIVRSSGLIFLVIIAIWAAYLLQHWVRRREHLATARSVDRFSEAMRVLERRTPLPASDLSLPQPRSYSVSPARPSRSEIVVKRAQSSTSSTSSTPKVQRRPAAAVHSTPVFRALAGMSARRARGLSLLASLSLLFVVVPLAAFSVLPWWSVPVVVAMLAVDLVWLRHAAATKGGSRRADARVKPAGVPAPAAARPPARSASSAATRPAARARSAVAAAGAGAGAGAGAAEVAALAESPVPSPAEVDPSRWAPVPVPPPTYTLKAKAERPVPIQAAVVEPASTQPSSFDGLVDEGELDELLDRRRAAGA